MYKEIITKNCKSTNNQKNIPNHLPKNSKTNPTKQAF